jgi:uncharacterized repeat protein (TIGR01451 family)
MQRHKLAILASTLSALLISGAAMAANSAAVPGPGANGGGGCTLYSYSIQKLAVDRDGHDVDVASIDVDHDDGARFKIIVRNLGDCDLRRVKVTDFLPRGTELVDADPSPTFQDEHRIVWEDQRIEEGDRLEFRITVRNRDHRHHDDGRWITNNACAFTPLIGIRICASASAFLHDHEPVPVH